MPELEQTGTEHSKERTSMTRADTGGQPDEKPVENQWEGAEITNRLSIRPSDDIPGWWVISGKWEGQSATADTHDMMRLARLILARLSPTPGETRVGWVKRYRAEHHGATLRQALDAFEREHPAIRE